MAKYPGFLFYPGDYLRDTQCLSEKAQVAYDRIMCEHMRNICLTQERLNFFIKRLDADEIKEVKSVLTKSSEGFYIEWVRLSIEKSKAYSDSRKKNRTSKTKEDMKTYDPHMDIDIENDIDIDTDISINIKEDKKNKKFIAPSIHEAREYFLELMMPQIEADKFHNFYLSKKWKVGKNPMVDWKAAARGWALRNATDYKPHSSKSKQDEAQNSTVFQESTKAFREKETITGFKTVTQ